MGHCGRSLDGQKKNQEICGQWRSSSWRLREGQTLQGTGLEVISEVSGNESTCSFPRTQVSLNLTELNIMQL